MRHRAAFLLPLVLLAGCAAPVAEPQAIQLPDGIIASYRVRVSEQVLSEGVIGFSIFSATLHRREEIQFDVDLTIRQVEPENAILEYRLHQITILSPEEKRLPDRVIIAKLNPGTGVLSDFTEPRGPSELEPARLEGYLRRLVLIPPDGGQVEPGILWTRRERFELTGADYPVALDLPWRIQHERTDTVGGRQVASLLLERTQFYDEKDWAQPSGPYPTGGITTTGFARVDAESGLVRAMDLRELGRFSFPLSLSGRQVPWVMLTLQGRLLVTRTALHWP